MTDTAHTDAPMTNGATGNPAVSETVAKAGTTKSPLLASELLHADAGNVEATTVTMDHSGAESISAERVIMDQSDAKRLEARSAQLERSGVLMLKADRAAIHGSSVGVVQANELRLAKSRAVVTVSGGATVEGDLKSVLYIGPVDGNVRTMLTPVTAAGFGAGLGIVFLLAGIVRRLVGRA
jgi:hypothetical protein